MGNGKPFIHLPSYQHLAERYNTLLAEYQALTQEVTRWRLLVACAVHAAGGELVVGDVALNLLPTHFTVERNPEGDATVVRAVAPEEPKEAA